MPFLDPSLPAHAPTTVRALRHALIRDLGDGFAGALQEAGTASGSAMMDAFDGWCSAHGLGHPEALAISRFRAALTDFLAEAGWGRVRFVALGDAVVAIEADDWAEAVDAPALSHPGCFFSAGMLADLIGRVADGPMACLEVTCRATGDSACRFLLGSPAVLTAVHERIVEGSGYEAAVRAVS